MWYFDKKAEKNKKNVSQPDAAACPTIKKILYRIAQRDVI